MKLLCQEPAERPKDDVSASGWHGAEVRGFGPLPLRATPSRVRQASLRRVLVARNDTHCAQRQTAMLSLSQSGRKRRSCDSSFFSGTPSMER